MSKWKPNRNDYYYFPFIHGDVGGPMPAIWQDSEIDNERYKMGVVCRTQSEAVELARKMLAVAKERVKNVEQCNRTYLRILPKLYSE